MREQRQEHLLQYIDTPAHRSSRSHREGAPRRISAIRFADWKREKLKEDRNISLGFGVVPRWHVQALLVLLSSWRQPPSATSSTASESLTSHSIVSMTLDRKQKQYHALNTLPRCDILNTHCTRKLGGPRQKRERERERTRERVLYDIIYLYYINIDPLRHF